LTSARSSCWPTGGRRERGKMNETVETRDITQEEIASLSRHLKKHKEGLWGKSYQVMPTLVHTVFGDGGQLISLEPTNSRPWYYLILAPSNIESLADALEFVSENEEAIFQSIEEMYGNFDDDDDDDNADLDGSMPLNIGSGYTCGYFDNYKKEKSATPVSQKS